MSKSWSIPTRYLVFVLTLAALLWLIIAARELIGPLAISALLAYILNPIVTLVNTRTKLSRTYVVALVYLASLAILIGIGFVFIPTVPAQMAYVTAEAERLILQVEESLLQVTAVQLFGRQLISMADLRQMLPAASADFLQADVIFQLIQTTTTNLVWIAVILITTYYLLLDWGRLRTWVFNLAPADYRQDMYRLYHEVKTVWRRYVRGQLLLMLVVGLLTGIASAAVGLPGAVIFGLFAGLLDAILTLGPTLVMLAAMLVALFAGSTYLSISNFWFMILVLGIHLAIQGIENVWLRPRIMGSSMRIHPAVVFVGIIGALSLAGILAALIIIPVIGSVGVVGRYVHAKVLDQPPWPEDLDPDEAAIADTTPEPLHRRATTP